MIFVEKLFRMIMGFYLVSQVARVLGANEFGMLMYIQSLILIVVSFVTFGMDSYLIKEFSITESKENYKKLLATTTITRFTLAFVVFIVYILCVLIFVNDLTEKKIYILLGGLILTQTQSLYTSCLQGLSKVNHLTLISLLSFIVSAIFKLYLINISASVELFALSVFVDSLVGFIMFFMYFLKESYRSIKMFNRSLMCRLCKSCLPLMLSSLIIAIYARFDQWLLVQYLGYSDIGVYTVGLKFTEAASIVPMTLSTALLPYFSRKSDKAEMTELYFSIVYFVTLITYLTLCMICPYVIKHMFGSEYSASLNVIYVNSLAMIFGVMGLLTTNYLIFKEKTQFRLQRVFMGLIINVILNLLFIPSYGVIGAAFAGVFSQIFASYFGNLLVKDTRECFNIQTRVILSFGVLGLLRLKHAKKNS